MWKIATNILNKQLIRRESTAWGLGMKLALKTYLFKNNTHDDHGDKELDRFVSGQGLLNITCECDIEPPGFICMDLIIAEITHLLFC